MYLDFTQSSDGFTSMLGAWVNPFIQVSPPIVTLQFLDTNILIALDGIVVILIIIEIAREVLPKESKKYADAEWY